MRFLLLLPSDGVVFAPRVRQAGVAFRSDLHRDEVAKEASVGFCFDSLCDAGIEIDQGGVQCGRCGFQHDPPLALEAFRNRCGARKCPRHPFLCCRKHIDAPDPIGIERRVLPAHAIRAGQQHWRIIGDAAHRGCRVAARARRTLRGDDGYRPDEPGQGVTKARPIDHPCARNA